MLLNVCFTEKPAIIRPWLQSFTATWVKGYIPIELRSKSQIDAALKLGIDEYLIWNLVTTILEAFLTQEQYDEKKPPLSWPEEKGRMFWDDPREL